MGGGAPLTVPTDQEWEWLEFQYVSEESQWLTFVYKIPAVVLGTPGLSISRRNQGRFCEHGCSSTFMLTQSSWGWLCSGNKLRYELHFPITCSDLLSWEELLVPLCAGMPPKIPACSFTYLLNKHLLSTCYAWPGGGRFPPWASSSQAPLNSFQLWFPMFICHCPFSRVLL